MYVPTFPLSRIISLQRAEDNACANNGRLLGPSYNNARGKREIRFPVLSIQSWFLWLHRIECGQFKENGLATVGITWNFTDLKGNFSIQPFNFIPISAQIYLMFPSRSPLSFLNLAINWNCSHYNDSVVRWYTVSKYKCLLA